MLIELQAEVHEKENGVMLFSLTGPHGKVRTRPAPGEEDRAWSVLRTMYREIYVQDEIRRATAARTTEGDG